MLRDGTLLHVWLHLADPPSARDDVLHYPAVLLTASKNCLAVYSSHC